MILNLLVVRTSPTILRGWARARPQSLRVVPRMKRIIECIGERVNCRRARGENHEIKIRYTRLTISSLECRQPHEMRPESMRTAFSIIHATNLSLRHTPPDLKPPWTPEPVVPRRQTLAPPRLSYDLDRHRSSTEPHSGTTIP